MMRMIRLTLALASCSLFTAACGPSITSVEHFRHPESGGIKRAAFEMECPEDQLQVTDLGGWTIGVTGCGKKAVFKLATGAGWVNNTATEEQAQKK